jgi:hypothetical protein
MAVQMYLVQPKDGGDPEARETIAEFIASRQGFILMATGRGALIVAFDENHLDGVKDHYLVDFVGGVRLNPNGPGGAVLQRLFARNVAQQLASRGTIPPGINVNRPNGPAGENARGTTAYPPGYRPLRWPRTDPEGGD